MGFRSWFVIPDESVDKIQFCTYGVNNVGSPIITFTIEIHATHEWQLKLPFGILSRDHHDLLQALPVHLRSVSDVKLVTDLINACKNCKGIDEEKYETLIEKQKGRFYDYSGVYYVMFMIIIMCALKLVVLHLYSFICRKETACIL